MALHTQHTILFEKSFSSDKNIRKDIVELITQNVYNNVFNLEISREEFFLSIDEAITNAMEHGNKWNAKKMTSVKISSNTEFLYITIMDEGRGFNPDKIDKTINNKNRLKRRGRGIYIMNQFCSLSWNPKGNEITLKIKLAG